MPQKVCPRCGAQYASLKSATCPQCFAKLIEVDDAEAAEMAAARAAVESSPEYQRAKEEEDDRFRHHSFQACLGGVAMALALLVLAVVLILSARRHHDNRPAARRVPASYAPAMPPSSAQARVEDVMPAAVGPFRREKMDERATLSGTLTLIYHAAYRRDRTNGAAIDVYAIPADRPAAELARFRDVVQLASLSGSAQRSAIDVPGKLFLYELIVPAAEPSNPAGDGVEFQRAWVTQVGGSQARNRANEDTK